MNCKRNQLRICAIAICLSAALALTGCATSEAVSAGKGFNEIMTALRYDLFGSEDQNCEMLSLNLPVREGFSPTASKYAYASLKDETMKEVYRKIEDAIYQVSPDRAENGCFELKYVRLPSSMEFDDIYIVKEAVIADHPEAFWIMGSYTVQNNFHDGNYLVLYSKYSAGEIKSMFDELNQAIIPIFSRIPDGADELARETIIHDALVDTVSYDFEAAEADDSSHNAFNVYGALVSRKAVCTGYAGAMKMLLNLVGVECRTVVGMSKNSGHMWNQVRVNGDWYNLDVTWDDSAVDSDVLYSRYNYFNITDNRLAVNHKTGENYSKMECEYTEDEVYVTNDLYNFDLDVCTATQANYYEMYALHLNALDDAAVNVITDQFIASAKVRKELVYIIFDDSIDGENAETWMSKNSGTKYSALGRALSASNKSVGVSRIKNCSLVRMSSGEDDIWNNLYAVRLIYA